MLGKEEITAITRIIAGIINSSAHSNKPFHTISGLITNTTMVTTMSTNSTTEEATSSTIDVMIVEEEVMSSKGTTIGTMTKTDSSQEVMTRIASINGSKKTATLSRLNQFHYLDQ